jgi:hypothetical protein
MLARELIESLQALTNIDDEDEGSPGAHDSPGQHGERGDQGAPVETNSHALSTR